MIKRYKARIEGSAVLVKRIHATPGNTPEEQADFEKAFAAGMQATSPRGQVAKWRPLADKHGAGALLDQAEALIDKNGNLTPQGLEIIDDGGEQFTTRFDLMKQRAISKIISASNEEIVIPLAKRDQRRQAGCAKGGQEGGASKREAAEETRQKVIKAAEDLLEIGTPRREIASRIGMRLNITPRHIRGILNKEGI